MLASTLAAQDDRKDSDKPNIEFLPCTILVVDPDGNPVQKATVYYTGMRTRIEPGSHWVWCPESHGPLAKLALPQNLWVRISLPTTQR